MAEVWLLWHSYDLDGQEESKLMCRVVACIAGSGAGTS